MPKQKSLAKFRNVEYSLWMLFKKEPDSTKISNKVFDGPLQFTNWIRLKTFTWKPLKHLEGIAASVTGRLDQKESTSKSIRHQK